MCTAIQSEALKAGLATALNTAAAELLQSVHGPQLASVHATLERLALVETSRLLGPDGPYPDPLLAGAIDRVAEALISARHALLEVFLASDIGQATWARSLMAQALMIEARLLQILSRRAGAA